MAVNPNYFVSYATSITVTQTTTSPSSNSGSYAVTMKYPSDNESGSMPPSQSGNQQGPVTLKYPSDNETGTIPPTQGGNQQGPVTMKYPSDNETGSRPPCGCMPPNANNQYGNMGQMLMGFMTMINQMLNMLLSMFQANQQR